MTRNLQVVMFSTVTFVPTYNNICTIYDKETYLYNIGYPDAITFLNGIIPSRDIFHTCNESLGQGGARRRPKPPDNYNIVSFFCANQSVLDFCFADV